MSSSSKIVTRVAEEIEKFEADNLMLRQTEVKRMGGQQGHRSEFTEWYDVPPISTTTDGLSLSQYNEFTSMSVPHRVSTYTNVEFTLNNTDTLDSPEFSRKLRSGLQALDNRINRAVANAVMIRGSQTVTSTAALSGYSNVAAIDTLMTSQDVSQITQKTLALSAQAYNNMAGDLANRDSSLTGKNLTAYEKAMVGEIAGYDTFKTSFVPNLALAAGTVAVDGAQSYTPTGSTLDAEGNPTNTDNRTMVLTVDDTTGVKAGDKFTIATVNAVSLQNKEDTSSLRTFTVVSVPSGTTMEISPPVIPVTASPTTTGTQAQKDYANVTIAAPDAAALVFLNTASTLINPFWENEAVCINVAPVVGSENDLGGMILANQTTDLGLNVVLAKQGDIDDLSTKWRLTTFFGVTVRDPLKCGVLLGSQP